jgi:hypothetical protein
VRPGLEGGTPVRERESKGAEPLRGRGRGQKRRREELEPGAALAVKVDCGGGSCGDGSRPSGGGLGSNNMCWCPSAGDLLGQKRWVSLFIFS